MTRAGWVSDDEIRDLGFDAVVARESRQRLLNRNAGLALVFVLCGPAALTLDVSRLDSIEPVA